MKVEKEMYVRYRDFDDTQKIAKIVNIVFGDDDVTENYYWLDTNDGALESDIIGEPSYEIVDLIEVGDYVNGSKVGYIDDCKGSMRQFNYDYEDKDVDCGHWSEEIKTVLTREQFEREAYKV